MIMSPKANSDPVEKNLWEELKIVQHMTCSSNPRISPHMYQSFSFVK